MHAEYFWGKFKENVCMEDGIKWKYFVGVGGGRNCPIKGLRFSSVKLWVLLPRIWR
jgi:hypothetical protein